jgi:hypothetical protein
MKLYHGTSAAIARKALDEGLLPRRDTGRASHWTECPSREDLVYLTTAYAGYFACNATDELEPWGIVEIDTDTDLLELLDNLVPDEDWLEQGCRAAPDLPTAYRALDMEGRTAYWRERLTRLGYLWEQSVESLGNCAHVGPIPPEAITRVAIFDPRSNPNIAITAVDPTISILNYRICQGKYHALIRWFMGEEVAVEDFYGLSGIIAGAMPARHREACRKMLAQRDGLTIIEN